MSQYLIATIAILGLIALSVRADEPQKTGWPLTEAERAYILKPEYERRPGADEKKHLPDLWPSTPSAGFWGGTSWLNTHAKLVDYVKANPGPVDVLLVGDSITQQWGAAWQKHFGSYKALNIGIGGDKTQNVLWRLDHGGVEGIQPRLIVLMIGNNNMFFTPETGVAAAAKGVKACVANLRAKFPKAEIVVAKILPAHAPGNAFYEDIKKTNVALDPLKLESDPKVHVLDLWSDFTNANGTIKPALFTPDNIHLSPEGYRVYAERLKPFLDKTLGGKGLGGGAVVLPKKASEPRPTTTNAPAASTVPAGATPRTTDGKRLLYPYAPYNEGKLDPQLTGWPLTEAEKAWVAKGEYTRKPGHEPQKHLPEHWFVTPSAAHWGAKDGDDNPWLTHHATNNVFEPNVPKTPITQHAGGQGAHPGFKYIPTPRTKFMTEGML